MKIEKQSLKLTKEFANKEKFGVNIVNDVTLSKVVGFGGVFTECAGYNYSKLTDYSKKRYMKEMFSVKAGAGLRFCRVPIGSSDFTLSDYSESYKEDLSDFNVGRDKQYIIPMIKDALKYCKDKLYLLASPWSPPAFMKDSKKLTGGGHLLPKYYGTYAEYFVKFIKAYAEEGIRITGVTMQNEAHAVQTWESCVVSAEEEGIFAADYLRPALDKAGFSDVEIVIWDHNRERLFERAVDTFSVPGARDAIAGIGFHWYSGDYFENIDLCRTIFPEKRLYETELCNGFGAADAVGGNAHPSKDSVFVADNATGASKRAFAYAREFVECLRRGAAGVCEWNLLVDENGGPYHNRVAGHTGCFAPFYCKSDGTLKKDPIHDVVKAISVAFPQGSTLYPVNTYTRDLIGASCRTPDGKLHLALLNLTNEPKSVFVRTHNKDEKNALTDIGGKTLVIAEIEE